jgi:ATP-dependent Clp protease ATP-binding subunit ClpC
MKAAVYRENGGPVVIDCEGDPDNVEKSTLVFRGADRGPVVPDAVPADLGAAEAE